MNKILSLLFLFFLLPNSYCQTNSYIGFDSPWKMNRLEARDYEGRMSKHEIKSLKNAFVKSRKKTHYFNGKQSITTEFFDREGRIIRSEKTSDKKTIFTIDYVYNANGRLTETVQINAKGQQKKTTYRYNKNDQLLERSTINFKNQYFGSKTEYNAEGKVISRKIFEKKRENPKRELRYTYYENGDKKTTTYLVSEKIKHIWNFDCKPEGELINVKNKDQSTICILEEYEPNGNRVLWERKFNSKGELTKYKTVYSPDSLTLLKERYNSTNRMVFQEQFTYNEAAGLIRSESKYFPKKGEPYVATIKHYYGKKGSKTIYYDKKGKITRTYEYQASETGKPLKIQRGGMGKSNYTILYSYINELKQTQVNIHKNRTIVDEFEYFYYSHGS